VINPEMTSGLAASLSCVSRTDSEAQPRDPLDEEIEAQARELLERVTVGQQRLARAHALVESLSATLETDERLLERVQSLMVSARQPSLDTLDVRLRGARLREVAVEVLLSRVAPGEPVHYRDWYAWVGDDGFRVAGRDPLATFLAQVTRAPGVRRVGGPRSGRYALTA
jgi:hypothetical protein